MDHVARHGRGGVLSPAWLKGRSVCELGCGQGLAGLGFALRGANVHFTDKPEVLEHTKQSVAANTSGRRVNTAVYPFIWGSDPASGGLRSAYDVVLATDPVYRFEQA